jgi:hypothetical protein
MGCIGAILGALVPRVLIIASWINAPDVWGEIAGQAFWPILGFIFAPWTTFFYVLFAATGFDVVRLIVMVLAVLADMATWGIGAFSGRKQVSNYRD